MDILHVCLSSGLSVTCDVANQVAEEINKTSPNKVYILDSKSATQGQNAVLTYAMLLRNEGKTALETKEILEKEIKRLCVTFFLGDLEALKRGGRISGAQAAIAKMVQLRPVLKFDQEGKLQIIEKKRESLFKGYETIFNDLSNTINSSIEDLVTSVDFFKEETRIKWL